jgi:hypothetical protein
MVTVSVIDETITGARRDAWHLEIFEERLPLREVIRRRVFQEVAEYNARRTGRYQGLVEPTEAERALNGAERDGRGRGPSRLAAEEQYARVLEAFGRNGFVVLVGDAQVDDLDAPVELRAGTEITFLKLVPLVGG